VICNYISDIGQSVQFVLMIHTVKFVIEAPLGEIFCERGALIKILLFLISKT